MGNHYSSSVSVDFDDLAPSGNTIKFDGCGDVTNKNHAPLHGWGNLISISINSGQRSQIFLDGNFGIQVRHKDNTADWTEWKTVTLV